MSLPRKALIAVTGAHAPMDGYPEGEEAGLFILEALHPYLVFSAAGFDVEFASENGTYHADYHSLEEKHLNGTDRELYEDTESKFRKALDGLKRADEVDAQEYGVFFAAGGHATMLDFPEARTLQEIAANIYKRGGIVSAPLIEGKRITAFADEAAVGTLETVRRWNATVIDEAVERVGGTFVVPPSIWDEYTVVDGRIVTGVNPKSANKTAVEAVRVFEESS